MIIIIYRSRLGTAGARRAIGEKPTKFGARWQSNLFVACQTNNFPTHDIAQCSAQRDWKVVGREGCSAVHCFPTLPLKQSAMISFNNTSRSPDLLAPDSYSMHAGISLDRLVKVKLAAVADS